MSFVYLFVIFIHLAVNSITEGIAIFAVKGSTGQLVCPYTSTISLRWLFKSTLVYTINEQISPYLSTELKQRLSVTGNHNLGEYHLTLSDIQASDQGTYQCIDDKYQSNTQDLIVIVGPTNINIENVTPDSKIPGIEGQDMTVKCTAVGGQPQPDIKLVILGSTYTGKQSAQHTYIPIRSYDGSNVICLAGYEEINSYPLSTSANIYLMHAPGVTVENKTFPKSQSSRQIHSTLDSNPPVNACTWQHKSKFGETIRDFSDNNQILTLPTVSEDQRYQDTGEYICTAENGIVGMNGQFKQTGYGYVISNAPPVITADNKDNSTQYGKFGKSTKVYVNVYSIPKYSSISWYIGNIQLVSNKYVTNKEHAIVKDVFHGVEVQLDGYRFTLTISDLQVADFTNYTLRIFYGSQYVQHEVTLESASAPETPSNFTITSSSETSITVQWIPGYDGGLIQTYYVQYRITGTDIWIQKKIKTSNQVDLYKVYTLTGLQDDTSYALRIYAKNKFNQSQHTDIEIIRTHKSEAKTSSNATIGTVAGVLVVLLIVCAVIISILIFKKRKDKNSTKKNAAFYENSGIQNAQIGDKYEEVVSKSDTQEKQTSQTYEALRTKEAVDVYDDLENSKDLQLTNSTSKTYESLGTKDAVETYDDLDHHKGLPSNKPSVDHYEALDSQDKPNVYEELESQKGQAEKVYVNEAF